MPSALCTQLSIMQERFTKLFRRWRCPVNGRNVAELLRFCRAQKVRTRAKIFERACRLATRLGAGVGATIFFAFFESFSGTRKRTKIISQLLPKVSVSRCNLPVARVAVTCVNFKFVEPSVTGRTKHMTTNRNPRNCATNPMICRQICNIHP